ncbi:MAG TPA: response regulator [Geobacteraceae bacterium]
MSQQAEGKPVDILLVDDNPGDIRLTREALQEGQVSSRLRVAYNGRDALALLRQAANDANMTLPDIIFLDLNLPGMNGLEILAEIKGDDRFRHIPVVVFSTSEDDRDICRAYEHSASCYVVKQSEVEKFTEVLKSLVRLLATGGQKGGQTGASTQEETGSGGN